MSKKSDQFEILVSRIHELLEEDNAVVEWNERIPDPDNPKQGRQVDVLVRKGDMINLIECRLHKEPQDVTWIEELIGRRISLCAMSVIAVSASGFTEGAIKKANSYGFILKDLVALTEEEIRSWSRSIEISLFYYRYENFEFTFLLDVDDIKKIDYKTIQGELLSYVGFRTLFTAQLELIDKQRLMTKENRNKHVNFKVKFKMEDFKICNCVVKEIESQGVAYVEELQLKIPEVLAYGSPAFETTQRDVYVQSYNLGETKVIHREGHVSVTLDLSKLEAPPYWQFRDMALASEHENFIDLVEIVSPQSIEMKVDKVNFSIVAGNQ